MSVLSRKPSSKPRSEIELEITREKIRRSLLECIKHFWPVLEPGNPFVSNWHIEAICEHLEAVYRRDIRDLLINMPPRHMKSLTVSVFWPIWVWIQEPEFRWLTASYALQLAIRDTRKSRRVIESDEFKELFGHEFHLVSDQNVKSNYENNHSGYRIAVSVNSAVTGEGGDGIILDDAHNVMDAQSDVERQNAINWWFDAMSTRVNDPQRIIRVVVGQRIHENDLYGELIERGYFEHLNLPAEYEGDDRYTKIGWQDPREEDGELLFPARYGPDELDNHERDLGQYGYAGQFQQRPAPAAGGLFKNTDWRFYFDPPDRFDGVIQSWDMAFKKTAESSYVCGQVWGWVAEKRYLLALLRQRMDFNESIDAVIEWDRLFPLTSRTLIEEAANGIAVINSLQAKIPKIEAVQPLGGKVARANAAAPMQRAGTVYLPHPSTAPWVESFMDETSKFPNAKFSDQVDAMTQALTSIGQHVMPGVRRL
jgi:predicted phage terminase large subunit-like protein